ncbi:MAG: hypothetical protein R2788_13350 [Saprospiraceae bacterium]
MIDLLAQQQNGVVGQVDHIVFDDNELQRFGHVVAYIDDFKADRITIARTCYFEVELSHNAVGTVMEHRGKYERTYSGSALRRHYNRQVPALKTLRTGLFQHRPQEMYRYCHLLLSTGWYLTAL